MPLIVLDSIFIIHFQVSVIFPALINSNDEERPNNKTASKCRIPRLYVRLAGDLSGVALSVLVLQ